MFTSLSVKFRNEQKKREDLEKKKFQAIAEKKEQDLLKITQRNEVLAFPCADTRANFPC
jgi:hypothetical protein